MQILNNNKQFSTLSDLSTAVLRHNLKIRVEKKQNRAINSDQEFETVLLFLFSKIFMVQKCSNNEHYDDLDVIEQKQSNRIIVNTKYEDAEWIESYSINLNATNSNLYNT